MINKRGGLGSLVVWFFAIIVIIIILVVFILAAGALKLFVEQRFVSGNDNNINEEVFSYVGNGAGSLEEVKFFVADGRNVDAALMEVGYG